ncbi:DUF4212 domain-containing protein [Consotaella salsifontis]|uniref:Putative solute:sodium symporter small subunit n=1 Tax=Consotaella salsifontis TaxID=1365950 RepID=A0A1T4T516_9HYPH|nr:DUF4212 domain-containing protein [Consotaella salsifontis]SKA35503.1 putative solute:sodium symporter small subunit [Consotaella salsifontis]
MVVQNDTAARGAPVAVDSTNEERAKKYWRANMQLVAVLLVIWALVSIGCGIILRPLLSGIQVGGTDLGFWFAQQGSIITFIIEIFVYAWRMNRLDHLYEFDEL